MTRHAFELEDAAAFARRHLAESPRRAGAPAVIVDYTYQDEPAGRLEGDLRALVAPSDAEATERWQRQVALQEFFTTAPAYVSWCAKNRAMLAELGPNRKVTVTLLASSHPLVRARRDADLEHAAIAAGRAVGAAVGAALRPALVAAVNGAPVTPPPAGAPAANVAPAKTAASPSKPKPVSKLKPSRSIIG